ncbi:helix-turn-helix domain-containing protein [Pseudozobellia sp. WGM2]|uniref:helix-turn-helix domain-containing protein n=1 Tax=Pseudozobellia sp. WGM2 TaxID=2787625 RepID=UPI00352CAFB0
MSESFGHIDEDIEGSKFKKEYLIERLGISRATFYNKIKKKNFTIDEMVVLSTILFPEEA